MGVYVNPGNEGFESAVNSPIYIDKTDFLQFTNSVLGTEQRYICMSRPRRFGKSVTAEMLVAYYCRTCNSREMFDKYAIAKKENFEEHLNRYEVIHVDINSFLHRRDEITGESVTARKAVKLFHELVVGELQEQYPEVVLKQNKDLAVALTQIYEQTGYQFVIIIDEWDALFRENREDATAQKEYLDLLRSLFKDAPSKKFLKLAYLTGILPIKKYGTQSALNDFDEYTMINPEPLGEYVGFTEDEVSQLCEEYDMDFTEAKRWYDGYVLGENLHIYNPKSVVDSMQRRKFTTYWTSTETYESLLHYISMNYQGLKDDVVRMMTGGRCQVNSRKFQNDMMNFRSKDDVLTLLIHLGYLAYDDVRKEAYIPNEEVRSEFQNAVEDTGWDSVVETLENSDKLLRAVWAGDEDAVAAGVEKVHMQNTSILKYNDENSLSCVIALAFYNAINEYTLIRELPTGKGYADIVFLPRRHSDKPALVIELKVNNTSLGALQQIKERKYTAALEEYQGNLLLVGINYDKECKTHSCRIEQIEW